MPKLANVCNLGFVLNLMLLDTHLQVAVGLALHPLPSVPQPHATSGAHHVLRQCSPFMRSPREQRFHHPTRTQRSAPSFLSNCGA